MDLSKVPCKGEEGLNTREEADVGATEKNGKPDAAAAAAAPPRAAPRYWECMKNHAAALGLHALDGCGEFMPGGDPSTLEGLRCSACGCHRNFHRRDHRAGDGVPHNAAASHPSSKLQYSVFFHPPPPPPHFPAHDYRTGGSTTPPPCSPPPPPEEVGQPRKRCRTMFTREQKEEMRKFAEKVGWSIQGHDSDDLREFCARVGVRRHVLKVWMHNNKGTLSGAASGSSSKNDPAMPDT